MDGFSNAEERAVRVAEDAWQVGNRDQVDHLEPRLRAECLRRLGFGGVAEVVAR